MGLRPYQQAALEAARAHYRDGARWVLIVGPTGMGKTVLFSAVAREHIARGGRVLVVVHRRELLAQARARLEREGIGDVGVIIAGQPRTANARVQVASVGTLLREAAMPDATLVIFDEAHHFVADQWAKVAARYSGAKILGVTATPERADGTPLGDLFERIVIATTVRELTDARFLVPCRVVAPARRRRTSAVDALEAYREHANGRPTVVFCTSVEEARELADAFVTAGVRAACVDGKIAESVRAERLEAFARGELDVLTNVHVLTEGWDQPRAEVCILARGCSSVGTYLQIVGRILRPSEGKSEALLVDLRGAVHAHGLPDEERTFSLAGRPIGRGPTKACKGCGAKIIAAARVCPLCGTAQPARAREDEGAERLSRVDQRALERAFFVESLQRARLRGYRRGWIVHRFLKRFGKRPWALWREFFPKPAGTPPAIAHVELERGATP